MGNKIRGYWRGVDGVVTAPREGTNLENGFSEMQ